MAKFPQRTGFLKDDAEFLQFVSQYPQTQLNEVEEAYYQAFHAFKDKKPRKTGEPAFEHSRRAALRIAKRLNAAGVCDGQWVSLMLRHDILEDTDAAMPWANRLHAYDRLPTLYGEDPIRMWYLVTCGPFQEEIDHLKQLDAGEEFSWRRYKGDDYVPLNPNSLVLMRARAGKVDDRLDNMETYCVIYTADQLERKLGTMEYYFRFSAKAQKTARMVMPEMVPQLMEQGRELAERYRECEEHLHKLRTSEPYRLQHEGLLRSLRVNVAASEVL